MNKNIKTPAKIKIDYIKEHLANISNIVNASVNANLLDEAFLFEETAKAVCELYYGKEFINLNYIKKDWPCVDLTSKDKEIFVQVSVTKYTNNKINKTLKKLQGLKDENDNRISEIKRITFFLLNSINIKTIEKKKINDILFEPENDIISFEMVLNKAKHEKEFRDKLYNYLLSEFESVNETNTKLHNGTLNSKNVFLTDIVNTIGTETYHIDREHILDDIKKDEAQIIVVKGDAGVGKSAICKEAVEDARILLTARAEEIISFERLSDFWSLDLRQALYYANKNRITVFIDSLEFVSDYKGKDKIVDELFSYTKMYQNLKVFVSCRTRDIDCFSNLFLKYKDKMSYHSVGNLSDSEKDDIFNSFPELKKISNSIKAIMVTPLYADLILKHLTDGSINNETDLKDLIYKKCICLEDKNDVDSNKLINAINQIVIKRSKEGGLGVDESLIDKNVFYILFNNGIIIKNEHGIRLKYDLFEDVCFAKLFEKAFNNKEDIDSFFKKIKRYGGGYKRRYHIWIGDLIAEKKYDAVVDILSDCTDYKQRQDTIVGILTSNFSGSFIEYCIENDAIDFDEYIKICNQFCFALDKKERVFLFKPIGIGRLYLANHLPVERIENRKIDTTIVVEMLADLIQQKEFVKLFTKNISDLTKALFENELEKKYANFDTLSTLITITFYIQNHSKEWFIPLMNDILDKYLHKSFRDGQKIIADLLKFRIEKSNERIITYTHDFSVFMSDIAFRFLTTKPDVKKDVVPSFYSHNDDFDLSFGLSDAIDLLPTQFESTPIISSFFITLLDSDYLLALKFLFKLTDFIGDYLLNKRKATTIVFDLSDSKKKMIFSDFFMQLGERESSIPSSLSDMFYSAKLRTKQILDSFKNSKENSSLFLTRLFNFCFSNSNTIASISLLSFVGDSLFNFCPNLLFPIISCYEIVINDKILYQQENNPDINVELLEKQIYESMGVPFKKRYNLKRKIDLGSILYSLYYCNDIDKEKYKEIMQEIFSKYHGNLDIINFYKNCDGSLKTPDELTKEQIKQSKEKTNYIQKSDYIEKETQAILKDKDKVRASELIKFILSLDKKEAHIFSRWLIYAISVILMDKSTSLDERNRCIEIWIKGIQDNESFIFDNYLITLLAYQLRFDIKEENKKWIKRYIFDVLSSSNDDVNTREQENAIITFLPTDADLRDMYIGALLKCSTAHSEIFGSDKQKLFSSEDFSKLQLMKNRKIKETGYNYLLHHKKTQLSDFDLKTCEVVFLEKVYKLYLMPNNSNFNDGFTIISYLLELFYDEKNQKKKFVNSFSISSMLIKLLMANMDSAIKTIDFIILFIKTNGYNSEVFDIFNRMLCGIENLLFGTEENKQFLFRILQYFNKSFNEVGVIDLNNEIKNGLILLIKKHM